MTTLAKIRALHEEVCAAWRKQTSPGVSEGEGQIINLGFALLERFVQVLALAPSDSKLLVAIINNELISYFNAVNSQFNDDADIAITEGKKGE